MHGTVTLGAEVTNVSTHCFWLLLGDEELSAGLAQRRLTPRSREAPSNQCLKIAPL
jgi:hypothetical protein